MYIVNQILKKKYKCKENVFYLYFHVGYIKMYKMQYIGYLIFVAVIRNTYSEWLIHQLWSLSFYATDACLSVQRVETD